MALWIATLRMTGLTLLGLTAAGTFLLVSSLATRSIADNFSYVLMLAGTFALALMSLSVAAGLHTLRDIDQRTRRQNGALRMLLPRQYKAPDLAPHAPTNWTEYKQRPVEPERERDQGFAHRFAQRHRYTDVNLEDESQQLTRPMIFRRRK